MTHHDTVPKPIDDNIYASVQASVIPFTLHVHQHAGPTEDDLLAEIRKVLDVHEKDRDLDLGPMSATEVKYIAACAVELLARRVESAR